MEFVGWGQQGLGQQAEAFDPDGGFAGAGMADLAGDPEGIGEFEEFGLVPLGFEGLFAQADLQAAGPVLNGDENELAGIAQEHDAAGDLGGDGAFVGGFGGAQRADVGGGDEVIGALAKGVHAQGAPLFEAGEAVLILRIVNRAHKGELVIGPKKSKR